MECESKRREREGETGVDEVHPTLLLSSRQLQMSCEEGRVKETCAHSWATSLKLRWDCSALAGLGVEIPYIGPVASAYLMEGI